MNKNITINNESDFYRILPTTLSNEQMEILRKKSFSDLLIERSFLQRTLMKRTRALELFHQQSKFLKTKNFINSIYQKIDQEERDSNVNNLRIQEILIKSCSSNIDAQYTMDVKNREDLNRIFKMFDEINEIATLFMEFDAVQEIVIRANHALHFKSMRMMKFYLNTLKKMDKKNLHSLSRKDKSIATPIKIMNNQKIRDQIYQDISILQVSIDELDYIFMSILPNSVELPQ
ncbi:MAG: hypothetical protein GX985_02020 [Gallicola sp.]|nr:hypothetical protein [Gallicola sp.]